MDTLNQNLVSYSHLNENKKFTRNLYPFDEKQTFKKWLYIFINIINK